MKNPKVSIIIPVYNGSNYMREAIDSALAQTYGNFEVLVVNDGSNDGGATRELALSYGDRIRYFEKENGGVATALNLGIAQMDGEYFSWLSHDDLYYPNKLEAQIEALRRRGDWTAIVYSDFDWLDMDTHWKGTKGCLVQYPLERLEYSIFPAFLGLIHGCNLLIHKSHFARVGTFDESLRTTQDYDLWFRMLRGQRLVYVPQPLICGRRHSDQGSNTISCFRKEQWELWQKVAQLPEDEILDTFGHPYFYYQRLWEFLSFFPDFGDCEDFRRRCDSQSFSEPVREQMRTWLQERRGSSTALCIFCCGDYGKHIHATMSKLGIEADCFSDNNPAKWGQTVDGLPCIPPKELAERGEDTLAVVSKYQPEDVLEQLKELGLPHVLDGRAFEKRLFECFPLRDGSRQGFGE